MSASQPLSDRFAGQSVYLAPICPGPAARPERDHVVDLVKGFACFLMVMAHVHFADAGWLGTLTLASVMFFASTGMNLFGLAERRPGDEWRIAANALFLIFAGFANNYVQGTLGKADVFQSAGMAMIAMLILRRLAPAWWTWLFPLPFLIHWLNQNVYFWKITDRGVSAFFLAPGLFPLLPWLTFYLLGAHLKRYNSSRQRAAVWMSALAALAVLRCFRPFDFNKFWMSTDYWLLGLAGFALLLDLARAWERRWPRRAGERRPPLAEVRFWGANSLVFYILHAFVLRLLDLWIPGGLALFLLGVTCTAALLRAGLALQDWARRRRPSLVLAAAAAVAAGVLWLEAVPAIHQNYELRMLASFGLTFGFVAAYPAWKNISALLGRGPRATRGGLGFAKPPAPAATEA